MTDQPIEARCDRCKQRRPLFPYITGELDPAPTTAHAWIAQIEQRLAQSRQQPDLRVPFTQLAERYQEIAENATTDVGKQRAMQIRRLAEDVRHILATSHIPSYLMTSQDVETEGGAS
ncbi:hypothetical protein [Streptomyces syringium]|uniref:hypothetical protein n=1 Tax=Streptomyces syringium TaxID=76729 RepID=UPI0034517835